MELNNVTQEILKALTKEESLTLADNGYELYARPSDTIKSSGEQLKYVIFITDLDTKDFEYEYFSDLDQVANVIKLIMGRF